MIKKKEDFPDTKHICAERQFHFYLYVPACFAWYVGKKGNQTRHSYLSMALLHHGEYCDKVNDFGTKPLLCMRVGLIAHTERAGCS